MTLADAKAALVAAYSSGEKPTFLRTLPGGRDEVWALAGMLIGVPTVPPDAPSDLEYALRLRRDALINGKCPDCDAVPSLNELPWDAPVPMAAALFNHRVTCAGNDKNARMLLTRYQRRGSEEAFESKIAAMTAKSRERVAGLQADGIEMRSPEAKELVAGLLEGLLEAPEGVSSCIHLSDDPVQVWNVLIAERTWKCDQCWAYFGDIIRLRYRLDPFEEGTCDLCRRYAPNSLQPLLLRVDNFVMHGGACSVCGERYGEVREG